jgi:hypothetical protein
MKGIGLTVTNHFRQGLTDSTFAIQLAEIMLILANQLKQ